MVIYACDFHDVLHCVLNCVNLKDVVNILHYAGKSFKAHTCVDIGLCKSRVVVVAVIFKLSENKIPNLNISVALTTNLAIGFAAALIGSAVKIYLRARAAGACAMLPEVIFFAESYHMRGVNADLFCPDVICFIVFGIYADIELVLGHFENLCEKFPRPSGCLAFKIIAEREVAEHFKKCAVTCGFADIINIGCAYALLAGGYSASRRSNFACEVFFHRRHAGIYQKNTLITLRHQGKTRQTQMTLTLKK